METICEMETISGMEIISAMAAIVFVVTGKNIYSRTIRAIGIAIGTETVTIGGMATGAASSTDHG